MHDSINPCKRDNDSGLWIPESLARFLADPENTEPPSLDTLLGFHTQDGDVSTPRLALESFEDWASYLLQSLAAKRGEVAEPFLHPEREPWLCLQE